MEYDIPPELKSLFASSYIHIDDRNDKGFLIGFNTSLYTCLNYIIENIPLDFPLREATQIVISQNLNILTLEVDKNKFPNHKSNMLDVSEDEDCSRYQFNLNCHRLLHLLYVYEYTIYDVHGKIINWSN